MVRFENESVENTIECTSAHLHGRMNQVRCASFSQVSHDRIRIGLLDRGGHQQ